MPAERYIPISPRKDQIYSRPSAIQPMAGPLGSVPTQLPPFSSLPPYVRTPSPPSTPMVHTSPFRVGTPPSSVHTSSSLSTRFPASPVSPTKFEWNVLPPVSLLLRDDWRTARNRGDTSPSKNPKFLEPGSPSVDTPDRTTNHKDRNKSSRSAGAEGNTLLTDPITCGWPDCTWTEQPLDNIAWNDHLYVHYDSAKLLETENDGKVACMWTGCSGYRLKRGGWLNHSRKHDRRFWIYCPNCRPNCRLRYATTSRFASHMAAFHPPRAGLGEGGSGDQDMNDSDDVVMEG